MMGSSRASVQVLPLSVETSTRRMPGPSSTAMPSMVIDTFLRSLLAPSGETKTDLVANVVRGVVSSLGWLGFSVWPGVTGMR